jgi:hypothetical protein
MIGRLLAVIAFATAPLGAVFAQFALNDAKR